MKINTDWDKEKGLFALPNIVIGYKHKEKELTFIFIFACWYFAIEICF